MQISSVGSTGHLSGLASGIDTAGMIRQMAQLRRIPIAQMEARKASQEVLQEAYQGLQASLLGLSVSAVDLQMPGTYQGRSVSNSHPEAVAASVRSGAAVGSYSLQVSHLAQAHKLASGVFASAQEALGLSGEMLVNGKVVALHEGQSLTDLASAINGARAGVSATLLRISADEHRLVLTASQTGAAHAVDLGEGGAGNLLEGLGLVQGTAVVKHAIPGGAGSGHLESATAAVGAQLGLAQPPGGQIALADGTGTYQVEIDLSTDSLQIIADKINQAVAGSGMSAAVAADTVEGQVRFRLEITGTQGQPGFTDAGNVLQSLGVLTKPPAQQIQAAQDAQFTLDGYALTRANNSVDDAVSGLSLQLLQADPGRTVSLQVSPDNSRATEAVQAFVNRYNGVMDGLNQGLSFNPETGHSGVFFGESAVSQLQQRLIREAIGPVGTLAARGEDTALSVLGLSVDSSGRLQLNTERLQAALAQDPLVVQRMLGTTGWSTNAQVQYVSSTSATRDSGASGFAVQITQYAAQATATGALLSEGIVQAETLTFNGLYQHTLQTGWSLTEARDHLNAFFQSVSLNLTASVSEDRLVVTHNLYGSSYEFSVASSRDQGVGGTDLGGVTAGAVQTFANGRDVAGTINGEAASGRGQLLSGAEGNATTAELTLRVSAAEGEADRGTVYLSRGLGTRMQDYLLNALRPERGSLALGLEAVGERISALDVEMERLGEQVDAYVAQLQIRFNAMEQTLARMQNLGSWLTMQVESLVNVAQTQR